MVARLSSRKSSRRSPHSEQSPGKLRKRIAIGKVLTKGGLVEAIAAETELEKKEVTQVLDGSGSVASVAGAAESPDLSRTKADEMDLVQLYAMDWTQVNGIASVRAHILGLAQTAVSEAGLLGISVSEEVSGATAGKEDSLGQRLSSSFSEAEEWDAAVRRTSSAWRRAPGSQWRAVLALVPRRRSAAAQQEGRTATA